MAQDLTNDAGSEQQSPFIEDQDLARRFDQHRASVEEAYQAYEELRAKCPVAHSDAHDGYYILVQHADVRKAAMDWKTYSSAGGVALPSDRRGRQPLPALEHDPPEHAAWRKLYTDAVVPSVLEAMEPEVERIADSLIDKFAARGECDLALEYCEPLPVLGISAVMGLTGKKPEEIRALAVAQTEAAGNPAEQGSGFQAIGKFILGELHARRKSPRNDYLTTIAHAEIEGRRMDDGELTAFMVGFLVAGHETTSSALTGLLFHVLSRPELKQRVMEDDQALAAAIEEAVRLTAPFHGFSRTTTETVEVGGTPIPKGQPVRLCFAAANRDPAVYADPDVFDIDRPSNPHLGFGAGRHVCAGAPFARLEMRIALRRLLARLPDIALSRPQLKWRFAGGMMTIPDEPLSAQFSPG